MNFELRRRWSGLDLGPLPHESTLSVLLRFGSRNLLSISQLSKLCGWKNNNYQDKFTVLPNLLNSESFFIETGWVLPQRFEKKSLYELRDVIEVFFVPDFRICPLCLESGFHSFWFQFAPLPYCPLHFCALEKVCHSCGNLLPKYSLSKDLFKRPYYCNLCDAPISGAPPSVRAHVDFRTQESSLSNAFLPYAEWSSGAASRLIYLRGIKRHVNITSNGWNCWCRPADFFLSVGCLDHSLPEDCVAGKYRELTVLRWCLRMADPPIPSIVGARGMRLLRTRMHCANQIYRSTLSLLQIWLRSRSSEITDTNQLRPLEYLFGSTVDLRPWDTVDLAYVLMRTYLDRHCGPTLSLDVRTVTLKDKHPGIWMPHLNGRTPRLAWRAVFLAFFATFYHTIDRCRGRGGVLDLRELHLDADDLIAQFSNPEPIPWLSGGVVFPSVDGLPLYPFNRNAA